MERITARYGKLVRVNWLTLCQEFAGQCFGPVVPPVHLGAFFNTGADRFCR